MAKTIEFDEKLVNAFHLCLKTMANGQHVPASYVVAAMPVINELMDAMQHDSLKILKDDNSPNYENCWERIKQYLEIEVKSADADETYCAGMSPSQIFKAILGDMERLEKENG